MLLQLSFLVLFLNQYFSVKLKGDLVLVLLLPTCFHWCFLNIRNME